MYKGDAYKLLGIAPGCDKKEIKKAYARLVKQYHPEEYPEQWKEIHDAYETLIKYEQSDKPGIFVGKTENESVRISENFGYQETGEQQEKREFEQLFNNLNELAHQQKQNEQAARESAMKSVQDKFRDLLGRKKCPISQWEEFFYDQENLECMRQGKFLYWWGDSVAEARINEKLYNLMLDALNQIVQYNASVGYFPKKIRFQSPEAYVRTQLRAAYIESKNKGVVPTLGRIAACICGIVLIGFLVTTLSAGSQTQSGRVESKTIVKEGQKQTKQVSIQLPNGIYLTPLEGESIPEDGWEFRRAVIPDMADQAAGKTLTYVNASPLAIYTESGESYTVLLWLDFDQLGMGPDALVYYYDGSQYVELPKREDALLEEDGASEQRYSFQEENYQAFVLEVEDKETALWYPVVVVSKD